MFAAATASWMAEILVIFRPSPPPATCGDIGPHLARKLFARRRVCVQHLVKTFCCAVAEFCFTAPAWRMRFGGIFEMLGEGFGRPPFILFDVGPPTLNNVAEGGRYSAHGHFRSAFLRDTAQNGHQRLEINNPVGCRGIS